jgi:hypothetical protein
MPLGSIMWHLQEEYHSLSASAWKSDTSAQNHGTRMQLAS